MTEPLWQPSAVTTATPVPPRQRDPGAEAWRVLDLAVTVVLLVVLAPLAVLATVIGLFSGMGIDGCGDREGCRTVLTGAVHVLIAAPTVLWVGAALTSAVLAVRGRRAWWVPLVPVVVWMLLVVATIVLAGTLQP